MEQELEEVLQEARMEQQSAVCHSKEW